jgi:CBS domain containing-hemolysin-like protein
MTKLLSLVSGEQEEPTVTEEELSTIIENVEDEGVIDEEQSELLQSALEFSKTTVADILTMHDDVVSVDVSMTNAQVLAIIRENKFSRLPVIDGDLDSVVGILLVRNFLRKYIKGEQFTVRDIMTEPYYVRLEDIIDDLMNEMSRSKNHMAIVKDKNGKTMGIVTVEDFLEELVGEIWDEDDVVDDNFIKLGGNRFDVSGAFSVGKMLDEIGCDCDDASIRAKSMQAWVLESLGHVPEEDEEFRWGDLTITVTELDENRVKRIEVKLDTPELEIEQPEDADEESEEVASV